MYANQLKRLVGLLLLFMFSGAYQAASAEPKTNDGSAAIKKMQGMVRQLSQEKTVLEAEKATLLTEKTAQDAKLDSLEQAVKKLLPLQGEVERYKAGLESVKNTLEAQLGDERQRQQALLKKHNEVVVKAKEINADNQLLVLAVQEREQWIEQCGVRNKKLHNVNLDILSKYQDKGLWQQFAELDPLTGIGKVETETAVEDFKYKLLQLKITPFQSQSGAASPKSAAVENGTVNQ